jgi:leucyl-tRNA synthetase
MYARFFTKALSDLGVAPAGLREPFTRLFTQGMIRLGGDKMSKSKGNLVAPEEILDKQGADALRLAHMFVGPPQDDVDWEGVGIDGCARFLQRVWRISLGDVGSVAETRERSSDDIDILRALHRLIVKVDEDFERWSYNTAVASFMEFTNELYRYAQSEQGAEASVLAECIDTLLLLMAPMAPHITAELWEIRRGGHIHEESWPIADQAMLVVDSVTMVIQINGKVRDRIEVSAAISGPEAEQLALATDRIAELVEGQTIRKVICRPPNLVNIVL